jgi:hypothetical protein
LSATFTEGPPHGPLIAWVALGVYFLLRLRLSQRL